MELINSIDETFKFEDKEIRVIGTYNNPLFVAKDICNILELSNTTEALRNIPEKWKGSEILNTLTRGNQIMIILKEAAVYQLVMRSNKPIAKKFQEVVCEDILPTLRKKGEYKIQSIIDKNKELEAEIRLVNEESNLKLLKIEEQNRQNICKTLIQSFDNKNIFYIGYIGKIKDVDSYKFGSTKKISKRVKDHEKTYERFELLFCIECEKHTLLEQLLKDSKEVKARRFSHKFRVENKKNETDVTELLNFDDKFNLDDLKKLLVQLKNKLEMSCELRLEMEKTQQMRIEAEIIHDQEETKKKKIELEEETKKNAKELEEQTRQKQLELEILKLKIEHRDKIMELNEEKKNEEIKKFQEELKSKVESEREIYRQIQENNNRMFEERIANKVIDSIDINIFENIYQPIQVEYKDRKTFLYIAKINDELYINVNSISEKSYPMDRWKRGAEIKRKILEYNFKLQDKKMMSIYSHKNKGTWILFDFFCKDYFNWYGTVYDKVNNSKDYLNFGTFLEIQLPKLIDEYDLSTDKYFMHLKVGTDVFKVRANRENNFINATDLFNAHNREIRTFNKNSERKKYFCENPEEHYLNGNTVTDEFGMKVTFCHPKLAILIVDWLYKNKADSEEKQQLVNFINYFMDKVEF
jgi:prophage antirepressor-like protein